MLFIIFRFFLVILGAIAYFSHTFQNKDIEVVVVMLFFILCQLHKNALHE